MEDAASSKVGAEKDVRSRSGARGKKAVDPHAKEATHVADGPVARKGKPQVDPMSRNSTFIFGISTVTFLGIILLLVATIFAIVMKDPNPEQKLAFIVLLAAGGSTTVADQIQQSRFEGGGILIVGSAVVFIFLCVFGAAFVDPEDFGNFSSWLFTRGRAAVSGRRQ
jgi:hypothetical protein